MYQYIDPLKIKVKGILFHPGVMLLNKLIVVAPGLFLVHLFEGKCGRHNAAGADAIAIQGFRDHHDAFRVVYQPAGGKRILAGLTNRETE